MSYHRRTRRSLDTESWTTQLRYFNIINTSDNRLLLAMAFQEVEMYIGVNRNREQDPPERVPVTRT